MPKRDDMYEGKALEPAALDHLWDAMNRQIAPVGGRTGSASITAAETIRQLGDRDDAPHLATPQLDAIWATVAAATLPAGTVSSPATPAGAGAQTGRMLRFLTLVQTVIRQTTIGAIAGLLVGMFVIGGLARVFMRVSGMLAAERFDGTLTNNGNRVGEISLSGTLELMFFGGAAPGLMGGIVVMAVRPWLPASGWKRYLLSGAIGFAVAGPLVLEAGENPDYKKFGIFGINVCMFTLLPFIFGVVVVPVIDAFDRRLSRRLPSFRQGPGLALASLPMFLFAIPLLAIEITAFKEPLGLLLLLPLIRVLAPVWARHAPTLDERHRRELRSARLGYAAMAAPCLLGLVLMAQSIARLL